MPFLWRLVTDPREQAWQNRSADWYRCVCCCAFVYLAAGFSDSVVRVYNLEQMGNARSKLPKYHKHQLQSAKRQKGPGGERVEIEPGIDVDTEMAELQVCL